VWAQVDTVYRLPDAVVVGRRHAELGDAARLVLRADSLEGMEAVAPLAQILGRRGGLYLRMYSPSGLAGLPLRGLSPAHTAVVWNDMPVVNPMNGVPDMSLLPVGLMQEVALVEGGAAALYGSGAMGGQLELQSGTARREGLHGRLVAGLGSFGEQRLLAKTGFRQNGWAATVGLAHRLERNAYPLPFTGARQQWARAEVLDLTLDAEAPVGKTGRVQLFGWWQGADRQIPPSLTAALTHDVQQDHSLKAGLRWTRPARRGLWKAMVGWQRDDILFFSDLVDSSFSLAHRLYARAERLWQADDWQWRLGVEGQYLRGRADGYQLRPRRTRADLLAFAKKAPEQGLQLALHGRLQWVFGEVVVPSGSVVLERRWGSVTARLALARNFRLPTFNDRYWFDGMARGNPDLKPEKGWNLEWGLVGTGWLDWRLDLHAARVRDWILWTPVQGIWQPH
ncbi:MAG: TonB-dependent receptor, partial [Alphaproteobacteria bacterium]